MFHKVQIIYCIFIILATIIKMGLGEVDVGECTCGGFTDSENLSKGILEQTLPGRLVSCDEQGAKDCQRKCTRMVTALPADIAVNLLCRKLNDTINILQMHLFAKICETGDWISAGYKTPKPICCNNGHSVSCEFK